MLQLHILDQKLADLGHSYQKYRRPTQSPCFRRTLINAANKQLEYLAAKKTAADLDYNTRGENGKYWWSSKAVDQKRCIRYYISRRRLPTSQNTAFVNNDPDAVAKFIRDFIKVVESLPDSDIDDIKLSMQKPTKQ